jgi:putative DNA primase/helicase
MSVSRLPIKTSVRADIASEDAAALAFVDRYVDCLRFDHSAGSWYRFDGACWRKDSTKIALQWARDIAREIGDDSRDDRARAIIGRAGFAKGVETLARVDQRVAVTSDMWDRDQFLLGTPDGVVDLRTGELREPDPADMVSKSTAVAPAPRADCPRFIAFLHEACGGDAELVAFLQRWFGYSLTGDVREQQLVFFVGDGGNGKSVLINTIRGLMGAYSANAAMDSFVESYGAKHPADMAALCGARLVTASETEQGRAWDEVRLKTLTGGDAITARHMRQNFFTFEPTFKLAFVGNHAPDLRSVSAAMRRRVNIVTFDHKPARPDLLLEQKLRAEWPAILRWAINGAVEWQAGGLRRPAAIIAASDAYFREQDIFGRWLEDECVVEPGNELVRTPSASLWNSWRGYAAANGKSAGRMNEFAGMLEKRGMRPYRTNSGRGFSGVNLREVTP